MFKPEHFDELKKLVSGFNWELLISNPNSDLVQDWVAEVNGLLWEFDGPTSEDFQKKIGTLKNLWGGVNAGTLPNYDLNHDISDIKQFLKSKLVGMRREKEKILSGESVSDRKESLLKFGEPGKPGQPGGGGSVFIQAEHFNIAGGGKISADGGDYISTKGDKSPINVNYGTIKKPIAETMENIAKVMELVGKSQLKEDEKRQMIGNAEIVKASLIQPKPNKSILQQAWNGMQAAATIAGVTQLLQMIGTVVLPLLK